MYIFIDTLNKHFVASQQPGTDLLESTALFKHFPCFFYMFIIFFIWCSTYKPAPPPCPVMAEICTPAVGSYSSDEADCDSVLSSCERSGTAIREKTGCSEPQTVVNTWPAQCRPVSSQSSGLGNSSNIDNCCYHCRPPCVPASSATNNQPTNWVKADTETVSQSRSDHWLSQHANMHSRSTSQVPTGLDAPS